MGDRLRGPALALIVQYLTGERKPQMPLGMPPLPPEQIELVRSWVAAGCLISGCISSVWLGSFSNASRCGL